MPNAPARHLWKAIPVAVLLALLPLTEAVPVAEAASTVVRRGPAGTTVKHQQVRPPAVRRTVVVAPVRPVPAVRPWYWGRVVAGVTVGAVIAATAVAVAPTPPSPELCWYWSDSSKTKGYWDYCTAPKP